MRLTWVLAIVLADAVLALVAGPVVAAAALLVPAAYLAARTVAREGGGGTIGSFVTTPSRPRTRLVLGVLLAGMVAVVVLTQSVVALLGWGAVMFATTLLLLDDSTGSVTNNASILSGRPVAPTARGRGRIRVDHVTPEKRREVWLTLVPVVAIVALTVVLVASST